MKKNTLFGTLLIVGIMIWWFASSASSRRAAEEAAIAAQQAKAAAAVADVPASGLPQPVAAPVAVEPAKVAPAGGDHKAAAVDSTAPEKPVIAPRLITVETDKFIMTLSNKGGRVQSVVAKVLPDSTGKFPELIQDTSLGAFDLRLGAFDLSDKMFDVGDVADTIKVEDAVTVQFVFTDGASQVIRSYGFTKDGPAVRQVNKFVGFQPRNYEIAWNGGMKETEVLPQGKSLGGASYYFSEVVFNNTKSVEREMVRGAGFMENETGRISWAGLRRKYMAVTMQFDSPVNASLSARPMPLTEPDPGTYQIALSDAVVSDSLAYNLMILPLQWDQLEALDKQYEKIIVSGWHWCGADTWFVWICKMLLKLLNLFYSIIPNYGVAIILVTLIVRGITTPFTVKQMKSTSAMSKLKPQLDEINVKYASDPQKKQAAIMELYSKNGVNPLASCTGGCLPMLFQMPIFMGLFFVLGRAIELRGMPAFLWISDLSKSDVIFDGFSIPFIMPAGIALLPLIMVVTTYFQTKVTMNGGMDPAQQKMMTWMMPAMMFLFSAVMPSGLVLYWIVSNIWSIAQYKILRRDQNGSSSQTSGKNKGKKVVDAEIVK